MVLRLLLALLIIAACSYAVSRFRRHPPAVRKKLALRYGLYAVAGGILLLVATGRVHWITAVFAGIVPFLSRLIPLAMRLLPLLGQLRSQGMGPQGKRESVMQSRFIKLALNPQSGVVTGEVLSGPHAGRPLAELSDDEIRELLDLYRAEDRKSQALLFAYLQYRHRGDQFRDYARGNSGNSERAAAMSRHEALEILGLEEGAGEKDIVTAHKRLMQKLHPDRGGSNYLAAKINEAKSTLVGKKT